MIKKILVALLIALPLCASAQKFGTIDGSAILPQMPEFTAANTQIEEASKKYEAEATKLREEIDKKMADFQTLSEDASTPESIKQRRVQELTEMQQKYEQFIQTAQQDLQRQQAQLMQPIQEKLMNAITSVGQENGFTLIFPVDAAAYAGQDVIDVTPLVKTKLGI